jgi:hypothetical protein
MCMSPQQCCALQRMAQVLAVKSGRCYMALSVVRVSMCASGSLLVGVRVKQGVAAQLVDMQVTDVVDV